MKLTNKYGLPHGMVEAAHILQGQYDPGKSDITATGLIKPPWMSRLMTDHYDEIVEDVSERIWAIFGSTVHNLLAMMDNAIVEERLYGRFKGWTVGMQFDRLTLSEKTLQDYKVASVWKYILGGNDDFIRQLNIGAELAIRAKYPVNRLEVIYLFRDWSGGLRFQKGYPPRAMLRSKQPLWPKAQRVAYINERVELHQKARRGEDVPHCTDEERWLRDSSWALMKKGRKKALRVMPTEKEIRKYAKFKKIDLRRKTHEIVYRQGAFRRCEEFCPVAKWCSIGREHWEKKHANQSED